MLKSKNLTSVLSQSVQQDRPGSTVISSILCTSAGRPVASSHNTRTPPSPHAQNDDEDDMKQNPYQVDRTMKTKVYGLLASSAWEEYSRSSNNSGCKWISITTTDALLVIHPVHLHDSGQTLLMIIVADPKTALGVAERKAAETVKVLEGGLQGFKIYD